jgi:hypothetical protein
VTSRSARNPSSSTASGSPEDLPFDPAHHLRQFGWIRDMNEALTTLMTLLGLYFCGRLRFIRAGTYHHVY